jgi:hypothetical protein
VRKSMTKEIEVKIQYNGKEEIVVVKKLTWGERNKVIDDAIGKIKVLGGETPQMEINQTAWRNSLWIHSVAKAPFTIDEATLNSLDTDVTDPIFKAALELNPFRDLL